MYAVPHTAPRGRADRSHSWPPLAVFAAIGLVPTSVLLAVAFWPSVDLSAYEAARPCTVVPVAPTSTCIVTVPLPVLDVWQTYGRGGSHYHFTLGVADARTTARVDAFLWWFPRFRAGETVQAEIWNGKITRLTSDGSSFITTASPLSRRQDFERAAAASGFLWLPFGLAVVDTIRRRWP